MSHIFNLKDVKSPWNGDHYIGFVLDVVNKYLSWNPDYYLPAGYGDLSKINEMSMIRWDSARLTVDKIAIRRSLINGAVYCIDGFPEEKFSDFRDNVQDLWDSYYLEMESEMKRIKQREFWKNFRA